MLLRPDQVFWIFISIKTSSEHSAWPTSLFKFGTSAGADAFFAKLVSGMEFEVPQPSEPHLTQSCDNIIP